jgi:hypothetical protein
MVGRGGAAAEFDRENARKMMAHARSGGGGQSMIKQAAAPCVLQGGRKRMRERRREKKEGWPVAGPTNWAA